MTKKKYDIPNDTPEELIAAFKDAACGRQDYSISDCVWAIIYDILDSVKMSVESQAGTVCMYRVMDEINDYITNLYGEL